MNLEPKAERIGVLAFCRPVVSMPGRALVGSGVS